MKKRVQVIFTVINSAVIFVLLIITAMLLFTANSQSKGLFGQHILLISNESQNEEIGEKCLVFVTPKDIKGLKEGDFFLYTSQGISSVEKADKIENTTVTYKTAGGQTKSFDTAAASYDFSYVGRISFKSDMLGEFFSALSSRENISLTFIIIFGVFVLSMLSIVISYLLYMKKQYNVFTEHTPTLLLQEESVPTVILQEEPQICAPEEEDEVLAELAVTGELFYAQIREKLAAAHPQNISRLTAEDSLEEENIVQPNVPLPVLTVTDEQAKLRQQQGYRKAFEDTVKKPPAHTVPPYYLSDEDVPSIDSIMESIDRQFSDETNEDEDIKIYNA